MRKKERETERRVGGRGERRGKGKNDAAVLLPAE